MRVARGRAAVGADPAPRRLGPSPSLRGPRRQRHDQVRLTLLDVGQLGPRGSAAADRDRGCSRRTSTPSESSSPYGSWPRSETLRSRVERQGKRPLAPDRRAFLRVLAVDASGADETTAPDEDREPRPAASRRLLCHGAAASSTVAGVLLPRGYRASTRPFDQCRFGRNGAARKRRLTAMATLWRPADGSLAVRAGVPPVVPLMAPGSRVCGAFARMPFVGGELRIRSSFVGKDQPGVAAGAWTDYCGLPPRARPSSRNH